jgi:hypothetical protein
VTGSIRIRRLDDGYLIVDDRNGHVWEGAAVTLADAEQLARHRMAPAIPPPPPTCMATSGYDETMPPALAAGPPLDSPERPGYCAACED